MVAEKLQLLLPLLDQMLGHKPSPATIWRWCRKGVKVSDRRVKLRATRIGGKLYATVEDVERFIVAQNPPTDHEDEQSERSPVTQRRLESAGLT